MQETLSRARTTRVVAAGGPPADLPGEPDGWLCVREYAHSCRPRMNQGHAYRYPVYIDGRRVEGVREAERGAVPPPDLQSRHLWASPFPGFESPGAANVKAAPCFARGDGRTDDTAALQQAIDRSEIVFLTKGYYRITRTLELRPRTRLVGVAQHLSVLVATAAEGGFADPEKPAPLIRTADDARAETVLAFCGLWAPHNLTAAYALHWRSGGRSVFRAVEISNAGVPLAGAEGKGRRAPSVPRRHPLVVVSGHGGGRWYNFREGGEYPQARGYRHLVVEDAAGPLAFYQLSPQHVSSGAPISWWPMPWTVRRRSARVRSATGRAPPIRASGTCSWTGRRRGRMSEPSRWSDRSCTGAGNRRPLRLGPRTLSPASWPSSHPSGRPAPSRPRRAGA